MQMKGKTYNGQIDAMRSIMQKVRHVAQTQLCAIRMRAHYVTTFA